MAGSWQKQSKRKYLKADTLVFTTKNAADGILPLLHKDIRWTRHQATEKHLRFRFVCEIHKIMRRTNRANYQFLLTRQRLRHCCHNSPSVAECVRDKLHRLCSSPQFQQFLKRLVKSPKLYFHDTGLACSLLEISNPQQLENHYLRGGLFENYVINQFIKKHITKAKNPACRFGATAKGMK